ncbi:hypothetical protein PFISCL1PPCAC_13863, partial [Pristionchus fissidentatus]
LLHSTYNNDTRIPLQRHPYLPRSNLLYTRNLKVSHTDNLLRRIRCLLQHMAFDRVSCELCIKLSINTIHPDSRNLRERAFHAWSWRVRRIVRIGHVWRSLRTRFSHSHLPLSLSATCPKIVGRFPNHFFEMAQFQPKLPIPLQHLPNWTNYVGTGRGGSTRSHSTIKWLHCLPRDTHYGQC